MSISCISKSKVLVIYRCQILRKTATSLREGFFFFQLCCTACGTSPTTDKRAPRALEARSLNHWTIREVQERALISYQDCSQDYSSSLEADNFFSVKGQKGLGGHVVSMAPIQLCPSCAKAATDNM